MEIRNSKTGDVQMVTEKDWQAINANELMQHWRPVATAPKPPEVVVLEQKKEASAKEATSEKKPLTKKD